MFGFLNVYKPKGMTSHDVIAVLRRVTKIKQIGHTGTLDPFAEGVLPVCIGKSTRLIEYLEDDKAYIGTIKFGESTTTYDIEGEIVNSSKKIVTKEEIEQAIKFFRGEIEQIPPIYSAIKVNGKKLYEYARKGEQVQIKPRKVNISEINLLNYDNQNKTAEVYIACSKGTYIRSIANDLGEKLGTYAHLKKLVREKAGTFKIKNSVKLEELGSLDSIKKYLINPVDCLHYPKYELSNAEYEKVSHGNTINAGSLTDGKLILTKGSLITAIAESKAGIIKCLKVFT